MAQPSIENSLAINSKPIIPSFIGQKEQVKINTSQLELKDTFKKSRADSNKPKNKPTTAVLIDILFDKAPGSKLSAIDKLAETRQVEVLPALSYALKNPNEDIRIEAGKAIGKLGFKEGILPLKEVLEQELDERIRSILVGPYALGRLKFEETLPILIYVLKKDGDETVRGSAAESLGRLGFKQATEALIESLKEDDSPTVKIEDAKALGEIKVVKNSVIEALVNALKDPRQNNFEEKVNDTAADALVELGPSVITYLLEVDGTGLKGSERVNVVSRIAKREIEKSVPYFLESLIRKKDELTKLSEEVKKIKSQLASFSEEGEGTNLSNSELKEIHLKIKDNLDSRLKELRQEIKNHEITIANLLYLISGICGKVKGEQQNEIAIVLRSILIDNKNPDIKQNAKIIFDELNLISETRRKSIKRLLN